MGGFYAPSYKNLGYLTEENLNILKALVEKYLPVLQHINDKEFAWHFAYVIEKAKIYINHKHHQLSKDQKALCVVVLKKLFESKKLKNVDAISIEIDKFVEYYNNNCTTFKTEMLFANEDIKMLAFIDEYINQRILIPPTAFHI